MHLEDGTVTITIVDHGPGIANIEQAMQPGFSTAGEHIRSLGFGAGMGLCNMKNCADEFQIESTPGSGTCLKAVVFLRPEETQSRSQPKNQQETSGE